MPSWNCISGSAAVLNVHFTRGLCAMGVTRVSPLACTLWIMCIHTLVQNSTSSKLFPMHASFTAHEGRIGHLRWHAHAVSSQRSFDESLSLCLSVWLSHLQILRTHQDWTPGRYQGMQYGRTPSREKSQDQSEGHRAFVGLISARS